MAGILFVENLNMDNDNPMSTCYHLKCMKIKSDHRFEFYDISEKYQIDPNNYHTVIFGCRSIYLYKVYRRKIKEDIKRKNCELCKIKNKYFIIQDMHSKTYGSIDVLCQFLENNNINIIFTYYDNKEAEYIRKKTPGIRHFHISHCIDTSIFTDLGMEKKFDILLFGSIHPVHYPFRKRLFELVLRNRDIFNVHFVERPTKFDPEICERGLSKLINQSKICIATKSKYDYLVGKYFEISLCKTLIAGNIPTDGMEIFKGRIIELDEKMSDQEIIDKIKYGIDNYHEYSDCIEHLYIYVSQNYCLERYPDKLYNLVNA